MRTRTAVLLIFAATGAMVLPACVGTVTRSSSFNLAPGQPVSPKSKLLILAVKDGGSPSEGQGSGIAVAIAIRDTLLGRGYSPLVIDSATLQDGLASARDQGYAF